MIAGLVNEMAYSVYDEMALDNKWYKAHKNRRIFIRKHLEANGMIYIQAARAYLAQLLTDPNLPVEDKDKIHEALCLDAAIRGPHDSQVKPVTII